MKSVSFIRTSPTELGEERTPEYTNPLSLDELLIEHPAATFFVRAGDGVDVAGEDLGVEAGDLLIVDRALLPSIGKLVLAVVEGELVLRRYTAHGTGRYLVSGTRVPHALELSDEADVTLWGTVIAVVRSV